MSKGDKYRPVEVTLIRLLANSIVIEVPKMQGEQVLARSLIHSGDMWNQCKTENYGKPITIRIFEWKADELHLA